MRIESTEASAARYTKAPDSSNSGNDVKINTKVDIKTDTKDNKNISAIEGKNISQMTDYERKELPVPDKVVIDAIEKANKAISISNRQFEYSIHEKTKQIMVKVVDSDTHEVIREIPPEKVLDMVAKMWEMAGIIVDERR